MAPEIRAVSLDVGGVLVVPDHGALAGALARIGVPHDRSLFGAGHYLAMAAVDAAVSEPEDFTDYLAGFLAAVAVPVAHRDRAHAELAQLLATPVWCQPVPGSRAGLAELAQAGVPLAITSNSDGSIADHLRRHEWVHEAPLRGLSASDTEAERPQISVPVVAITDSGVIGVGKPHPAMFEATVAALGVPPESVLHVGDSVVYDVEGAEACGLRSVHMDPYDICSNPTHPHIRSLQGLRDHRFLGPVSS